KTLWIRNVVDRLMSVPGRRPGALGAYGLAMVCVAMAAVLPPPFGRLEHDLFLFSALYVGILFASFWGGARAGIFAALLGGLFAWGAFAGSQFIGVMIYIVVSIITVVAADHQRRLIAAFEAEAELRKLLIHELDHRLKNKIASIQAIISYQLQDQQEVLHRVVRRLAALSSADALVEAGQGRGAYIGDIA